MVNRTNPKTPDSGESSGVVPEVAHFDENFINMAQKLDKKEHIMA